MRYNQFFGILDIHGGIIVFFIKLDMQMNLICNFLKDYFGMILNQEISNTKPFRFQVVKIDSRIRSIEN